MKHKNSSSITSLSKFIAQAGVCARRKAVDLIKEGVVTVNGTIVQEPGFKLNPTDAVAVRTVPVHQSHKIYILFNKPKDCITTTDDENGRTTVMDFFKDEIAERIYPVGRLDRNTTGVLLLTNDGPLAQQLSHPRNNVTKTYIIKLDRSCSPEALLALKKGVQLEDGVTAVDYVNYLQKKSEIMVELHSGKNKIIRRLFEALGYEVIKLDRVGYAGLTKSDLPVGQWRYLYPQEIKQIKNYSNRQ